MKLIVGIGNPGLEYQLTRHNVGFMVIDHLAIKLGYKLDNFKDGYFGGYIKTKINNEDVILFKPYTYMNDSGRGVIAIVNFFKINLDDIVVIHDDLDLETGYLRIRKNGGSGGHNGIKSIISNLNSEEFKRIRIGIAKDKNIDVVNYVLGKFTKEEQTLIKPTLDLASNAIIDMTTNTFDNVMNKYNKR